MKVNQSVHFPIGMTQMFEGRTLKGTTTIISKKVQHRAAFVNRKYLTQNVNFYLNLLLIHLVSPPMSVQECLDRFFNGQVRY